MHITGVIKNNRGIIVNIIGALVLKGLGMVVSLFSMPLYLRFFNDNSILGVWFTILTVLNWILSFDLGIGNGLRNNLTISISEGNHEKSRKLISSAYMLLGGLTILLAGVIFWVIPMLDWNSFFNISVRSISGETLNSCVSITLIGIVISFFLRLISSILYALQLAAVNNLITFITSLLLVLFLFIISPSANAEENLILISRAYAVIINIPLVIATVLVFGFTFLRNCRPAFRFVDKKSASSVLSLGLIFLVLQLLYMVITVTNEWFISRFFAPEYCVDYQIYIRIFSLVSSLFLLALSPLWSAITKAYAERRYRWIMRLQKVLYLSAIGLIAVQSLLLPFLQPLVNFWLGDKAIGIDYLTASFFLLYSSVIIWLAIFSTLVVGMNKLKIQLYSYIFAVVFKISVIIIVSHYTNDWAVVVLITAVSLLPYVIIQPFYIKRMLQGLAGVNQN